jgi:hypothetical protein
MFIFRFQIGVGRRKVYVLLLERLVIQPAHINGSYLIINPFMHSVYLPTYVSSTESCRLSCKVYLYALFNSENVQPLFPYATFTGYLYNGRTLSCL